jgi:hypothetical protein
MLLCQIFSLLAVCLSTDKPSASSPMIGAEQRKTHDPADRRIAEQIRQAIARDNSLSIYVHKITIITRTASCA